MSTIYVLHGLSNSGKSTAQSYLSREWDIVHLHPILPIFEFVHSQLGVPLPDNLSSDSYSYFERLTSQEFKSQKIPNTDMTVIQYLVSQWSYYQDINFPVSQNFMETSLPQFLSADADVCVGNLRNPHEVHVVEEIAQQYGAKVKYILLNSKHEGRLESDVYYTDIKERILESNYQSYTINNNWPFAQGEKTLEDQLDYIISDDPIQIYLVGPVAHQSQAEAKNWRDKIETHLTSAVEGIYVEDINVINPMKGVTLLDDWQGAKNNRLLTAPEIYENSVNAVLEADLVFAYIPEGKEATIGSWWEIGLATAYPGKCLILVVENKSYADNHPFLQAAPMGEQPIYLCSDFGVGLRTLEEIIKDTIADKLNRV